MKETLKLESNQKLRKTKWKKAWEHLYSKPFGRRATRKQKDRKSFEGLEREKKEEENEQEQAKPFVSSSTTTTTVGNWNIHGYTYSTVNK